MLKLVMNGLVLCDYLICELFYLKLNRDTDYEIKGLTFSIGFVMRLSLEPWPKYVLYFFAF
jgi:hypothetical protein